MKLATYALNQLEKRGRKKIIMDRDGVEPYLERYYISWPDSEQRERKDIPFNIFLHNFARSDDPVYHTHPWDWYFTLILKGGYWEHTPWGTTWRGPGTWKFQKGARMKRLLDNTTTHHVSWPRSTKDKNHVSVLEGNPLLDADLHWVEIPKPYKTWTLFIRGQSIREWGFTPDPYKGQWIRNDIYLEQMRKLAHG